MKRKKVIVIFAAVCIAAAVLVPPVLDGRFAGLFPGLTTSLTANEALAEGNIVQVGSEFISRKELEEFRAYKEWETELNDSAASFEDSDLLGQMIIEKLLLQKARELKVEASVKEARKEAARVKKILEQQGSGEAREFHARNIKTTGLTEKQYWNKYIVKEYRNQLTLGNLLKKLITDGQLYAGSDPNELMRSYMEYRDKLYTEALGSKVRSLDSTITLNE